MKFAKIDKIFVLVVFFIVILSILTNIDTLKSIFIKNDPINNTLNSTPLYINAEKLPDKVEKLPDKVKQTSQKYKFFEEVYTSDKPLLFFSYDPLSIKEKENRILYKNLTEKLEQTPLLKQHVKIYKNGNKIIEEIISKYTQDRKSCAMTPSGNSDFDNLIYLTDNCFKTACIIVPKLNKYYELSRDADYMLEQLSNIIVK